VNARCAHQEKNTADAVYAGLFEVGITPQYMTPAAPLPGARGYNLLSGSQGVTGDRSGEAV
jgi:hypothetical protein